MQARRRLTTRSARYAIQGLRAEQAKAVDDIVDHDVGDAGVHAEPERAVHNDVGVGEIARHPASDAGDRSATMADSVDADW